MKHLVSDWIIKVLIYNKKGQLGLKNNTNRYRPTKIDFFNENVLKITTGNEHTLILTHDKKLYSFGDNTFFQLGRLTQGSDSIPTEIEFYQIISNSSIRDISSGYYHNLILNENGQVFSFGSNMVKINY